MFQIIGKAWVWKENTEGVQFSEWDTMARISGQILHLSAGKWGILGSWPAAQDSQLQHPGEREMQELVGLPIPDHTRA